MSVERSRSALHRAFFPLHEDSAFQRIVTQIRATNPPIVRSTIAFTIAERDLHPEGIAFDPMSRAVFVGSFKGKIVRIDSPAAINAKERIVAAVMKMALTMLLAAMTRARREAGVFDCTSA